MHTEAESFISDLKQAQFQVLDTFDDVDDAYLVLKRLLTDIANDHAPVKQRKPSTIYE